MAIRCPSLLAGEIPAGEYFTRFYRRLVEWVDAEKMRCKDGFQHEMHHQSAERPLIQPVEVDSAHGTSRGDQRLRDGALLRSHEVARRVAGQVIGAGGLGEVGRDTGSDARRIARE